MWNKWRQFCVLVLMGMLFSCGHDPKTINLAAWELSYEGVNFNAIRSKINGWKSITLPLALKFPMSEKHDFQYIWLKTTCGISGDPAFYYGISISRISHIDQVYINGTLIGEKPPKHASMIPLPRNYVIPRGLLKKGVNEIYIRLGIYPNERAGIICNFIIQPENEFDRTEFLDNILYKQFPLTVVTVYITIVLLLTVLFSGDREEKLLHNFTVPCLGFALYIFTLYIPNKIVSVDIITGIHAFVIYNLMLRIYLIIQSIYKIYFAGINRIIIPLMLSISTVLFIVRVFHRGQIDLYLYAGMLLISTPIYPIAIYKLHKLNPDRLLLSMSLFFIVSFVLDVGLETIFVITGSLYSDLPSIYFSFVYFSLGAIIVAREFMDRRRKSEFIYNKLKILEEKKTEAGRELSITEASEDKLKTIIDFLNENYTSDLSREGLASAVDMNPNYMSRLFKTYTGKKISEYITELRIRDAAEKLRNKNARIIDIALAVGFDNIVTFNRAFKHVMDKTPTEFREEI
jgi:AraC-like DNA-binding protein